MGSARNNINYGRGEHALQVSEYELASAADLRRDLVEVFGDKRYQAPVLPAAAHEIMALSKRASVSFEDVRGVVEKDATIAGKVLQVAQSPIYATRVKAKTLRDAVQRLGLNNIRDIVWQVAMDMRVFRAPGFEGIMDTLQRHSVAAAHLARLVCGYTPVAGEYAFLCGLLHDVGLSGMLIAVAEKTGRKPPPLTGLWDALREAHADASGYLVRLWKLDADLQMVVTQHHGLGVGDPPHPLVAVVTLAERLAIDAGYQVGADGEAVPFEGVSDELFARAVDVLGLNDDTVERVRREGAEALARIG